MTEKHSPNKENENKPEENENAAENKPDEKGDYVLVLADNTLVRVETEGGTTHNGLPVIRSYYDPQ